jgi:hypothetical protein
MSWEAIVFFMYGDLPWQDRTYTQVYHAQILKANDAKVTRHARPLFSWFAHLDCAERMPRNGNVFFHKFLGVDQL